MGFPMTVERVISRNNIDPTSILADDIRRVAEDAVTLAGCCRVLALATCPHGNLHSESTGVTLPRTVWDEERERIAAGGHQMVGDQYGNAEKLCDHGRAAHNDVDGCTECPCLVSYSGGLVRETTT